MKGTSKTHRIAEPVVIGMLLACSLFSCDFKSTIFGSFDNQYDAYSSEFADYDFEVIAGVGAGAIPDDGPAADLQFSEIGGMTASGGYLYVSDTMHNRVIKINETSGDAVTIAGTGVPGYSGDGGEATVARLFYPTALAVGDDGTLYIQDYGNGTVRAVTAGGSISTYADYAMMLGRDWSYATIGYSQYYGSLAFLDGTLLVVTDSRIIRLTGSGTTMQATEFPEEDFYNTESLSVHSIAVHEDGRVFIHYYSGDDFHLGYIASGGTELTSLSIEPGSGTTPLYFDSQGRLVLRDLYNKIVAYDPATGLSTELAAPSLTTNKAYYCMSGDTLYWQTKDSDSSLQIIVKNASTNFAGHTAWSTTVYPSVRPYDVALDEGSGLLYFTEHDWFLVRSLNLTSGAIDLINDHSATSAHPEGIAAVADPAGAMYIIGDSLYRAPTGETPYQVSHIPGSTDVAQIPMGTSIYVSAYTSSIGYSNSGEGSITLQGATGSGATDQIGTGDALTYSDPDGDPADLVPIGAVHSVCAAPDGTLYFVEGEGRVLSVTDDGTIHRIAGGTWSTTDTWPVRFESLQWDEEFSKANKVGIQCGASGIAYGLDDVVYIAGDTMITCVNTDGLIELLRFYMDGTTVDIGSNHGIAVDADGCLYIPAGYQIIKATPRL